MSTTSSHSQKRGLSTLRPRRDSPLPSVAAARRRRRVLVADAVIASYIHDISVRHRRRGQTPAAVSA